MGRALGAQGGYGTLTAVDVDAGTLAFVIGVVLLAATAQSITGFGFSLVAVPLLVTALPVEEAIPLNTLLALSNTAIMARANMRDVPWETVTPLFAGAVVAMPLGLGVLLFAPADAIRVTIGVATLAMVAALAAGLRFRSRSVVAELAVGSLAGTLSTSTGVNGPPVVLYLQGREHTPAEFRAALAVFFTGSGLVATAIFAASGVLTVTVVAVAALALPAVLAGNAAGGAVARRIDVVLFRRLVYVLLVTAAASALASALF